MNTKAELIKQFDNLHSRYGSQTKCAVYGGGCEIEPQVAFVFVNPTARNIATDKNWQGPRYQWLGTKQIWKFLTACKLFDDKLNEQIQCMKPKDWTPQFCETVYSQVAKQKVYITNLAKCTQDDARPLPDKVFMEYRNLLFKEFELIKPKKIILFGNQVSSIVLGQKICVSTVRKNCFQLNGFDFYPVYYPVGNGFFNTPKAVEDIRSILKID